MQPTGGQIWMITSVFTLRAGNSSSPTRNHGFRSILCSTPVIIRNTTWD